MKRIPAYLAVVAIVFGTSCRKKQYPADVLENAAEYFIRGNIAGEPVKLEAGIEGYYMFSSYRRDASGTLQFAADLQRKDCPACGPLLHLNLADFAVSQAAGIDSSFRKGLHDYYNQAKTYEVHFSSLFNKSASSMYWEFGDGAVSNVQSPVHIYDKPGPYNVCLSATGGGCYSGICNQVRFDSPHLRTGIVVKQVNGRTMRFEDFTAGTAPYSYSWDFGDGQTGNTASPVHTYAVAGSYAVTLRITDSNGETAEAKYNAVTADDVSSCAVNFVVSDVKPLPSRAFSEITFSWTNSHGRKFVTSAVTQPGDSYFEITEVTPAGTNEKGEAIVKVNARFNCLMTDGITVVRSQGEMSVAMAYQ